MGVCVSCRRRERKAPDKRAATVPGRAKVPGDLPDLADMANSISNIKMTNTIKGMVSKSKKRYIQDGFNLDLSYITDRLIAMGFPAEKLEGVYRNHIDEVCRFLEQKHKDRYKIYNLCCERSYDRSKFHERVSVYPFQDHTPPKMDLIQPFCEDVHNWLNAHPENVAAVHCKAGKGRTGTMVCCYLLYSGQKATADEALNYYGTKRTHDEKGVTIPSQRRYVEYYAALVRSGLQYRPCALHVRQLRMSPPPALYGSQCALDLAVLPQEGRRAADSKHSGCTVTRCDKYIQLSLTQCTPLSGDIKVEVFSKHKMMRREKLFHFWFNTFFVANGVGATRVQPPADSSEVETFKLCLNKWQLDDAHKDKQNKMYSTDFKVELIVQRPPASSVWCHRSAEVPPPRAPSPSPTPSPPSSERTDSDTDNDEHWDSGEKSHQPQDYWDSQEKTPLCPPNANNECYPANRWTRAPPKLFNEKKSISDPVQYPSHCEYGAYSIGCTANDDASVSSGMTGHTDVSQPSGKIHKVSSDHTLSSLDAPFDSRTCKSPTEANKKKYLFFHTGKKDSVEEKNEFTGNVPKPRLSLGDVLSWRGFSDKHATEHSKDKKKTRNGQTDAKDV